MWRKSPINKVELKNLPFEEALAYTSSMLLKTVAGEQTGITQEQRDYYKTRPVEFSREMLGFDPYDKQELIMNSVANNERTTVRSAHGLGKSWVAAQLVLWFITCFKPSTVVTTAPRAKQVRDILWRELNSQHARAKTPLGGKMLQMNWEMSREVKWFATGFTTEEHNMDAFQGFHNENILVVIDESCGVVTNIFNAVEGLLSSGQTIRLLLIGNPTNEATEFGKSFKSPLYTAKLNLSAFDCPNFVNYGITLEDFKNDTWQQKITGPIPRPYLTSPQWVAGRVSSWGIDHPLFQVKVLGNFPDETENSFIALSWLDDAYKSTLQPDGLKVLGVDVAGLGRDESVATFRHGDVVVEQRVWGQRDPMESVGVIVNLIRELEPDVVNIDAIGEGSGVYSRLKELGYEVNGLKGSNVADNSTEYYNFRSELHFKLRKKLRDRTIKLPQEDSLTEEATSIKLDKLTSKGQQKVENKEDFKKRIGRSPDRLDSLTLTMCERVQEKISVAGDLFSSFTGGTSEVVSSDRFSNLEKSLTPLTEAVPGIYNTDNLLYNRNKVCPRCGHSEGLVFYKDTAKCLICNINVEVQ